MTSSVNEENFLYKYLLLEVFEKLYRLKKYIRTCTTYDRKNSDQRITELFHNSINIIATEVNELCLDMASEIDESTEMAILVKISQFSKAISKIHEELRNIHSSWILPEIKTFASEVTRSTLDGKIYIILSDHYSFLERNLGKKFQSALKNVFGDLRNPEMLEENHSFVLPKIEFSNPLNWTIIVHEAGHLNTEDIFRIREDSRLLPANLTSIQINTLKSWAEEIYCDIYALSVLGPSYFISFATYAMLSTMDYGIASDSEIHPSVLVRATIMINFLKDNELAFNSDFGINDYCRTFYEGLVASSKVINDQSKIEIEGLTTFNRNLRKAIKELNLCSFKICEIDSRRILRLVHNLTQGIPIGSVNDNDFTNVPMETTNLAQDIEQWKTLVTERSAKLWEILNSGWIYKLEHSFKKGKEIFFCEDCAQQNIMERIDEYGKQIDFLDDRMLASINSSLLIKIIEN